MLIRFWAHAALKGRLDIIQILEKAGGDLGLCNKDGRTALHLAVQHGHVETAKYIAQQSPTCIMKPTKSGRLPIQMAAALCDFGATVAYDITTFLFDHVPSREILAYNDKSGRGLLQDAVVARNLGLVRFLLNQGANPNQADSIGRSVIHHAAMMGHLDVLQLFKSLDNDALDWDASDSWDGWTPLMHAARQGHFPIVKFLVQHGLADQNRRDKHGRTANDIATTWNHCDISGYLTTE
ncbi:ankyrin repeat-containing domain protein [Fennellomyces sp. T-0311]|nr:ankyrin repeat-containing domain protein [Fennellomyces sp. T-0311]